MRGDGSTRISMTSLRLFAVLLLASLTFAPAAADPAPDAAPGWRTLEPGLDLGEFRAPRPSTVGDSQVTIARVDPARFTLDIYSAIGLKLPQGLPIDGWARREGLAAAINAGMFTPEGASAGYGRAGDVTLNPAWKPNYGAVLALSPDDPRLPAATILDPECDDVKALEKHYRVVLQSMRMIDCKGANLWQKSQKIWSTAALGVDDQGRMLFIHARSPWDVHDFNDALLELPLGLRRAMYLEGGPEASLSIDAGGVSIMRVGSWETGFNENDDNKQPWTLPIVIGARRVKAP
jgi:hypothetical protein